ncbi:hypothetical protein [uncultured Flavobacterium sp.]|uniref:hypothetical protein n=1 Tax=uncultured Flavobacterium sp. TaxID=165435 RepID=UPI0025D756A5|nr:hypothetical protein [uncultured Flavobacterium sp.]
MSYQYETPEKAVISLEKAYSQEDLNGVFASKDFEGEAKLILTDKSYEITDELVTATAKLLEETLKKNLQENGFPDFSDAERQFSELKHLNENIYFFDEIITYPNKEIYKNKVFLTVQDSIWKVAMINQIK